jgi:glycosyltransferase involved in cell wall biosynthesis
LIVVDDGSIDNTEDLMKSFDDERIRYIRLAKNGGAPSARNIGIKAATGEYIAFQDSDDEWMPEKLEKPMKAFEKAPPNVGVVYTAYYRIEDHKTTYIPSAKIIQKEGNIHKSLLKGNFIGTPTMLVKRECFEKAGMFNEEFPQLEDWELVLRISKFYEFKCIDEPLVNAYCQQQSLTANQDRAIKALEMIIKIHFADFKNNPCLLADRYTGLGNLLCSAGQFTRGRAYLIKGFKTDPLNARSFGAALASLFGQTVYEKVRAYYMRYNH